ncbi:ATP-binding protein [Flavobacterium soyangense]|uniref:histidine kinase n=1 Tax=Flavobacterium soyangense TaxID=2023265 RepID=A0A930U8R4_9FLAO|nr:ATP-binding protein [Flavobacterium soyangense]MBF2707542.1 response regulator [Flavobacterium soyangense]
MRTLLKKTYPKILFLFLSSSVFFIILYSALYFYTGKVEKQVYTASNNQFYSEVKSLLILESKPITVAINNDTNWDEFLNFIKTRDANWFNETIGNEQEIYKVDYLGAYDQDGKFIIRTASSKIKSIDFVPKQAMLNLNKSGLSRFYMRIPEGIIEVFGASIHPSNDPFKNKTRPSGYFFVARLMDKNFLLNLESLTNSSINFIENVQKSENDKHHIFATIVLNDCEGNMVTKLFFKRNHDVYFENVVTILYMIFAGFFINFIVSFIYTRKWVYSPLKLIKNILETGNKKAIQELKSTTGEFRYIGNLFEQNNEQKTELIKAKLKAEESDRLKSSFLANLSHEIRTPMNAINGFTDLLINTKLKKEERLEFLKIIQKSGNNLVLIIDDLIEISKIESNQVTPNLTTINLETCINELYETIKITIPKSKEIDFRIIEDLKSVPHNIIADEIKLKQILVNLVNNAIKFTDKGYVAFGYEIDEKNAKILFKIQDTGIGIDINNHEYVFDRFKRVDSDLSVQAGGLGLGLAISKAYVEMMGGTITLESKVNVGSTFLFSIPLEYDKEQRIIKKSTIITIDSKGNEEKTILIAEDDIFNFMLFQKIIEPSNYTILRAENGQEAVDICSANPNIDLVFMDIKMPIMNGFEALEKIKVIRPELIVVAQTAYSSTEDEARIYNAGFYGYITKPIDREKLFELVDNVFRNKNNSF